MSRRAIGLLWAFAWTLILCFRFICGPLISVLLIREVKRDASVIILQVRLERPRLALRHGLTPVFEGRSIQARAVMRPARASQYRQSPRRPIKSRWLRHRALMRTVRLD